MNFLHLNKVRSSNIVFLYRLEFLQKLRSSRHIERVKMLFESQSVVELKSKIESFKHAHISNGMFEEIPSIKDNTPIEEVGLHS